MQWQHATMTTMRRCLGEDSDNDFELPATSTSIPRLRQHFAGVTRGAWQSTASTAQCAVCLACLISRSGCLTETNLPFVCWHDDSIAIVVVVVVRPSVSEPRRQGTRVVCVPRPSDQSLSSRSSFDSGRESWRIQICDLLLCRMINQICNIS